MSFYNVKNREDGNWNLCPLCDSELKSCHVGTFCGNEACGYVDGIVYVGSPEEFEKLKSKLQIYETPPY